MPQSPEHPIEKRDQDESLEFLKRQEVRTMAKDVALLREEEAKKEREKIAAIKPEAPAAPKEPTLPKPKEEPQQKAPSLVPSSPKETGWKLPKKPAHFDKVFIRVALTLGVTFVLVNIIAFAVWNLKKEAPLQEVLPTPPTPPQELIEPEGSSEPERPISLFPVERTEIIEVQQPDQIVTSLTQFFEQNSEPGFTPLEITNVQGQNNMQDQPLKQRKSLTGFTRILLKDALENRFLTLSEVLQGANFILAPELGESDTLFLFVAGDFKRIGFAASLEDPQTASDALRAQEKTFEQDAAPILSVVGRKGQGYTTLFRTAFHKGVPIRFQTLSVRDLGIVYAIVKDTLVFSTSLESMKQVIDALVTQ